MKNIKDCRLCEYEYLIFFDYEMIKNISWFVDIGDKNDDEWLGCLDIRKSGEDYNFNLKIRLKKREQIMDIEKFIKNWKK